MQVYRLLRPEVFDEPEMANLLEATMAFALEGSANLPGLLLEAKQMTRDPYIGLLAGFEAGHPVALGIIHLPRSSILAPLPQVTAFFNAGSPEMREALIAEIVVFIRERGYMKFRAVNGSGRSDEAWAKLFAAAGAPTKVASIFDFELGD